MELKKIMLIGMGACGTCYARALYDAFGDNFAVIATGERREKLAQGVVLNGERFTPRLAEEDEIADLVLFSVKNYALEQAARDAFPHIGPETVILPTMNGITATAILRAMYPEEAKLLYGMDAGIDALRNEEGVIVGRKPLIVFGDSVNVPPSEMVLAVEAVFKKAGIPCRIGEDMQTELWRKWMWNIGINQATAALGATYGDYVNTPEIYMLAERAMFEVLALARQMDIPLSTDDILSKRRAYDDAVPFGKTSMAQDVENCRRTEVDYFAGMLLSLCDANGISAPVNQALYYLIKAKEKMYGIVDEVEEEGEDNV